MKMSIPCHCNVESRSRTHITNHQMHKVRLSIPYCPGRGGGGGGGRICMASHQLGNSNLALVILSHSRSSRGFQMRMQEEEKHDHLCFPVQGKSWPTYAARMNSKDWKHKRRTTLKCNKSKRPRLKN